MLRPIVTGTALRTRAPLVPSVTVLALTVVSLVSLGLPATLLLGGGCLNAAALRGVRGLDGPASWAAAVIVTVASVSLASACVALVSPHEHGRLLSLLVLLVPALVGVVGSACLRRREGGGSPSRAPLAAVAIAGVLLAPLWVASRGRNFGIAWAASGDARNHALLLRQVSSLGGLTLDRLRTYPAVVDNLSGLLSTAGGRHGLPAGQLMIHDLHAIAATYVLCCAAIAVLVMAALLELLPVRPGPARLPAPLVIVLLAASLLSATALVLGTSLLDGYLSAFGSLPLCLSAVVLALRCCAAPSPSSLTLMSVAAVLVFFSWTLVALLPVALIVLTAAVLLVRRWRSGRPDVETSSARLWGVATAVTAGTLVVLAGAVVTHLSVLRAQLKDPGSVTHPQPLLLYALALLAVALQTRVSTTAQRLSLLVPLVGALTGAALVQVVIWASTDGKSWTYYSGKLLYLLASSLVWLVFVPLLLAVSGDARTGTPPTPQRTAYPWNDVVLASAGSLLVLLLVGWTTKVVSPSSKANDGWNQPTAAVLTEAARVADRGHPYVLWQWSEGTNDKIGNFWAVLTWGYDDEYSPKYGATLNGGPEYWAYTERGTMHDLCTLAKGVNGVYVVTHNPGLPKAMSQQCPNLGAHIVVEPR